MLPVTSVLISEQLVSEEVPAAMSQVHRRHNENQAQEWNTAIKILQSTGIFFFMAPINLAPYYIRGTLTKSNYFNQNVNTRNAKHNLILP